MQTTTLTFEEASDIATIRFTRPATGNRIDVAMLKDLERVCHHLEDDSAAKVVVFRGEGPDFCQGIDFRAFDPNAIDIHGFAKWEKCIALIERIPKATVAAVHGRVEGGGLQLALACDIKIATADAVFRLPEVQLGFLPGMATFRLAKYIGIGRARRMMLTARPVSADEAASIGLIDEVVASLDAGIASTIASLGPVHTVAVEMARRLLNESFQDSLEDATGHFLAAQHRCVTQAAFLGNLGKP
jgi:enoyl-CoA hydratase/carnithine racemase